MTREQALTKIFADNTDDKYRLWKHRFKKNTLAVEKQEEILMKHGYQKRKESVWIKQH